MWSVETLNGELMPSILHLLYLIYPILTCLDPDSYSEYGSTKVLNKGLIWIRIHNTAVMKTVPLKHGEWFVVLDRNGQGEQVLSDEAAQRLHQLPLACWPRRYGGTADSGGCCSTGAAGNTRIDLKKMA